MNSILAQVELINVRSWAAGSTGRRNTGVKSLCWCFKLQGLTWSFVELTSHFVQMGLRMHRQVGALGKVLSQQAISIPRTDDFRGRDASYLAPPAQIRA